MKKKIENINKPLDPSKELAENLRSGLNSIFWIEMKKIIQENINYLTSQILGETNEEITDEQLRMLIKWRGLNKELIDLPESIIKSVEQFETIPEFTDLDPYHKTFESIMSAK